MCIVLNANTQFKHVYKKLRNNLQKECCLLFLVFIAFLGEKIDVVALSVT